MAARRISLITLLFLPLLFLTDKNVEASPLHSFAPKGLGKLGRRVPSALNSTFDYIVVGGGTAGLTVASRLTEDPNVRVAVIEAGDFYEKVTGNQSEIPSNDILYNGKDPADTGAEDWGFTTTPQAGTNGTSVHYARGKTLGGSSALNYMGYQSTTVGAMQRWADDVGDDSWTYDQVLKYYTKSRNFTPPDMTKRIANSTPEYDNSTLPQGGLLDVSYPNYAQPWSTWVARAVAALGMSPINGFTSGKMMNSSAWLINTITHADGFRDSSETAFLRPFLNRTNLVVYTNTLAERILFNGTAASGVQASSNNATISLTAAREVIVSCGTFQSPQLLQVSGVGPSDLLTQHGIKVVADRPGVGANMNDHTFFGITYRVNVQTSSALGYGNAMQEAIVQFDTEASGQLSSPGGDYAAYENIPQQLRANFSASSLAALATLPSDWPEIEYFSLPGFLGNFSFPPHGSPTDGYEYATIMNTQIAPMSRGNISISSASMHDQPLINPNWLTDPTDVEVAIAAFRRLREVFATPAVQPVLIGSEYYPGQQNVSSASDSEIFSYIQNSFNCMYHASSTCAMGKANDTMAVVDPRGKVYGVQNLRVVDASAFPFLPPGLPMGTVYMLAEKIADDIKNGR